jgi:hypothetical protein
LRNELQTGFFKLREIAADHNQWRAMCCSEGPSQVKRFRPTPDKTSGLSSDTALQTLISTKTYSEIPDEQAKRTKNGCAYSASGIVNILVLSTRRRGLLVALKFDESLQPGWSGDRVTTFWGDVLAPQNRTERFRLRVP